MNRYFLSKLFILLFALTFAFTLFSCNKDENAPLESDSDATEAVEATPEVDENRTYMKLDGNVKIFCTRQWAPEVKSACENIAKAIKEKTGLELQIVYQSDGSGSEIVVGYTEGHGASRAAFESITLDQYAVVIDGDSAVLAAYTKKSFETLTKEVISGSIVKQGDEWAIGSIAPSAKPKKKSVAVSLYKIVYAADADDYIVNTVVPRLQEMIFEKTKLNIEAVSDATPATPYEIVIGNTNRSTAAIKHYFEGATAFEAYRAAIVPDGSKLFLIGGEPASMGVSVSKMNEYITYSDYGPKLLDLDSQNYISRKMTTENPSELAEGADVRVMSYNVLNPEWGDASRKELNKVESRIDTFINMVLYYRPDVIGLQEAAYDWHDNFDQYLVKSGMYKPCCNVKASNYIMTGFLYNPSTLNLVDSYVIDVDPNSDHRVVSVAVFETIASGEKFVVINTHPAPQKQSNYAEHMKKITEIELAEMEKYKDLPILLTGDFNTYENQQEYATFKEALGVENSKDVAEQVIHNYAPGWFKKPYKCNGTCCIDHIFVNENVDTKLYSAIIDDGIEQGSDHIPIYADVSLSKSE